MKRICVLGCSGAGKTTLAVEIAARTGLPYHSLDAHYWQAGWTTMTEGDWQRTHGSLIATEAWVIDGNYINTLGNRLAVADTVVYLDYPRWRCLLGVALRTAKWWGRTRPEMGPDCPEHIDIEFLRYVWNFKRNHERRIADLLGRASGFRLIRIRDSRERASFLAGL